MIVRIKPLPTVSRWERIGENITVWLLICHPGKAYHSTSHLFTWHLDGWQQLLYFPRRAVLEIFQCYLDNWKRVQVLNPALPYPFKRIWEGRQVSRVTIFMNSFWHWQTVQMYCLLFSHKTFLKVYRRNKFLTAKRVERSDYYRIRLLKTLEDTNQRLLHECQWGRAMQLLVTTQERIEFLKLAGI